MAKASVEKGQVNCRELRDLVIQEIHNAGGRVDYAEVRPEHPVPLCVLCMFR